MGFFKYVGQFFNRLLVILFRLKELTPVQKWIIGVGAIFAVRNSLPTYRLGDFSPIHGFFYQKDIKEVIRDSWGVETKKQLLDEIANLKYFGHRQYCYEQELIHYQKTGQDSNDLDEDRYIIWDYCRIIQLYRWGYILGWLEEDWCWDQMLEHAKEVQPYYTSWEDMASAYLRGRELWAGGRLEDTDMFEEAAELLKTDEYSPWRVDWSLELKQDWN